MNLRTLFVIFGLAALLPACSANVETHGYMVEAETLAKIEPGRSTREDVIAILGSPSTEGNFGARTWYYVGQLTSRQAFRRPENIKRKVIYIDFDEGGKVDTIGELGLQDGEKIAFISRETPTAGQRITILQQLLGNIGRFEKPGG